MHTNAAVTLSNVSKQVDAYRFGPLDLEFEEGFVYAIVGPNGAGKSTLFSLIMNGLKPDQGDIQLFGTDYAQNEVMIKQRIGYASLRHLWEDFHFKRIKDLVQFISPWYQNWNDERFWQLAERFGLEQSQRVRKLSTGMRQRLAMAIAMSSNPDLLLLDEATNGLDFQSTQIIHDEILKFMGQDGKTVILATHILDEIKRLADYIIFIHEGQIYGMFEKDALLSDWKTFWIDGMPSGLEEWDEVLKLEQQTERLIKLVSSDAKQTERKLAELGIHVTSMHAIELQEILNYLLEKKYG